MSERIVVKYTGIGSIYWLFSLVYTFMVWGFWWSLVSIIFPIFPLIDLVKYIVAHG